MAIILPDKIEHDPATLEWLLEVGYNPQVAEALVENELSYYSVSQLSATEALNYFLQWNGILGYTSTILNAVDNCRNVEAL
jgi:hypothetical protein